MPNSFEVPALISKTYFALTVGKIDIHINDENAFLLACTNNHLEIAKYLISLEETHGKINIRINNDQIFLKIYKYFTDIIKYLCEACEYYDYINNKRIVLTEEGLQNKTSDSYYKTNLYDIFYESKNHIH